MKLNILHTNDLHGHLENWPTIREYLKQQRAHFEAKGEPTLLIDVGDALDSVHPLVESTQGEIMVDLFNEAGYDIVTIGNNEGLNFTNAQLDYLYARASYDVTLANLLDSQTYNYPQWAQPIVYRVIEGKRLAFIGLTAPYATYTLNGYELIDPYDALEEQLRNLSRSSEIVDLIVVLSHLGLSEDRLIAKMYPQIDLILGSHTHHVLVHGEEVHQSTLAASGRYGHYVGLIELEILPQQRKNRWNLTSKKWKINCSVKTIEQLTDLTGISQTNYYETLGRQILKQEPIAYVPHGFSATNLKGKQSFIELALRALNDYTNTPIAILSSGLFLSDLPSGTISNNDLHEALPHPMHIAILTFSGERLILLLEEMVEQEEDLRFRMISGMGFRGKIFGELVMRGVHYDATQNEWLYQNQSIDKERTYQVAIVDHYWFIPFFPTIAKYGSPQLLFPDFLRHVVADYLRKTYPITERIDKE